MQGYDNHGQGYYQPQPQGYCPPQPQQQQQHTVVMVNQPQSHVAIQGQPQNIRQWTSGMCGCCEDCCGCKIHSTVDHLCLYFKAAPNRSDPTRFKLNGRMVSDQFSVWPPGVFGSICLSVCLSDCLCVWQCVWQCLLSTIKLPCE